MGVTVYRSDDASAPILTAAAGSLLALLDACLVTGYGAKAAAGWGKPFTGTNTAAFRAASGNRHYLAIDDSPVQYAVARGYREMTGMTTGLVGAFPTTAQLAGGIRPIKSSTTSTVIARPWVLVAASRAFYLMVGNDWTSHAIQSAYADVWGFGEGVSYLPGDQMMTFLIGHSTTSFSSIPSIGQGLSTGGDVDGHYLASSYLQDGNGYPCGCRQSQLAGSVSAGSAGPAYPDPITGGLLLEPLLICEGGATAKLTRGHLPGVFNPLHDQPGNHLDTLTGRGELSGHDLLLLYKGGTVGRLAFSLNETDWLTPA